MPARTWFLAVVTVIFTPHLAVAQSPATTIEKSTTDGVADATSPPAATTATADATKAPQKHGGAFTLWEFQLDIKAFQHEPANKSLDEFETTLFFNSLMPHNSPEVQKWSGFGKMTAKEISRAANSDQAPHRPKPQFHLQASTFWDRIGKALQIHLAPKDAVTYSLESGEILGTTSILQYILPEAKGPKLIGNLQTFAIPTSAEKGATFHCTFDTMGKHVCWYEGSATLKIVGKRNGFFPPQAKQDAAASADQPIEPANDAAAANNP